MSSVQTGLSPEAVLQNSDEFLDFCMSNVYEYLGEDAQRLTKSLLCSPGLKDIPELTYLNDFEALQSQKAIQELMATNMLSQASITKGASVKTTYQLSELARTYLGKHHKPSQTFQKEIRYKRNQLNSIFEAQLSQRSSNKYSAHNIKFRDKSDRVIVKQLHDVQKHIANSKHDKAFEILQEVQRLAPDYFEVARFMAYFYQKSGNFADAREQYELAIVLSPKTPQLHYWFGKFLLHAEESVDEAVIQFEKAVALDKGSVEASLALARGYLFQHDFENTKKILDLLASEIDSAENHLLKMYFDTTIQVKYRTADHLAKDGEPDGAILALEDMKNRFEALSNKFKDSHMRKKLKKCDYTIRALKRFDIQAITERAVIIENWIEAESAG